MSSDHTWAQFRREGLGRDRFLAITCAVVATGHIAAVYLDPNLLRPHVDLSRLLFFAYFAYSEVPLSSRVCSELVCILQEAPVNIRKHSGARKVIVRFGRENEGWKLLIADDDCGFGLTGRLSLPELATSRLGRAIIKIRVRLIRSELVIESGSGRGARLEISLPPRTHDRVA